MSPATDPPASFTVTDAQEQRLAAAHAATIERTRLEVSMRRNVTEQLPPAEWNFHRFAEACPGRGGMGLSLACKGMRR